MPKERIWDEAGLYNIVVGWSPGQNVQVAAELHSVDPTTGLVTQLYTNDAEYVGAKLIEAFGLKTDAVTDDEKVKAATEVGLKAISAFEAVCPFRDAWSTLNRDAVNMLIRTLRKARDSAYGRDE
jgi:hypothetical protein